MKGYLLICGFFFAAGITYAQTEQQAIQQWQQAHPSIQFVSEERYAILSEGERALLGDDVILYKDKITLSQLQAYDLQAKSGSSTEDAVVTQKDKEVLKLWLAENADVKIVPRSVFDAADDARRSVYSDHPRCLILEGETLTVKDIERFDH